LIAAVMALGCGRGRAAGGAYAVPGEGAERIQVEVLNASGRASLARVGTRVLRHGGIDVVSFGNAPAAIGVLDSTEIVIRRGPAVVGERIRRVLGAGRVVLKPDSTLLVDASVYLGKNFTPPLDFHP
jgi:LytR cell envelope-related transcriptional attenuator